MADNAYRAGLVEALPTLEQYRDWGRTETRRILDALNNGVWTGGSVDRFYADVEACHQALGNAVGTRISEVEDAIAAQPFDVPDDDPRATWTAPR